MCELLYILIAHGNTHISVLLQTTVDWDGDKLVCVQRGEKQGRGWTHWLEGNLLHLVKLCGWSEKRQREREDREGGRGLWNKENENFKGEKMLELIC